MSRRIQRAAPIGRVSFPTATAPSDLPGRREVGPGVGGGPPERDAPRSSDVAGRMVASVFGGPIADAKPEDVL